MVFQFLFAPLLGRLARTPGLRREPTRVEKGLVHLLYAASAAMVVRPVLGAAKVLPALDARYLNWLMGLAAACTLFMVWAVMQRQPRVAIWFSSHLVWLALTNAWVALLAVSSLLLVAVMALVASIFPPLLFLIYALWVGAIVVAAWYLWRIQKGWRAFLRTDSMWQDSWPLPVPTQFPEA